MPTLGIVIITNPIQFFWENIWVLHFKINILEHVSDTFKNKFFTPCLWNKYCSLLIFVLNVVIFPGAWWPQSLLLCLLSLAVGNIFALHNTCWLYVLKNLLRMFCFLQICNRWNYFRQEKVLLCLLLADIAKIDNFIKNEYRN